MAMGDLLLAQQGRETAENFENVLDKENKRRGKAGAWASAGNFLGGGLGLLGAAALGLNPAGWGLVGIGGLAGLGSFGLGKLGQQWAGGREKQATNIGQNIDVLTGEKKDFSKRIQDKYRRDVSNFSTDINNAILSKAVKTGIKSAAFAGMNKDMWQKGSDLVRGQMGLPVGDPMLQNLGAEMAQAKAGQAAILNPAATQAPPSALAQATQAAKGYQTGFVPQGFQMQQQGLGPLSNVSYDKAVNNIPLSNPVGTNNPFIPNYMTNIAGSNFQNTPINPANTGAAFNNTGNFNQSFLDLLNMPKG